MYYIVKLQKLILEEFKGKEALFLLVRRS